jgi:hypothetical protein
MMTGVEAQAQVDALVLKEGEHRFVGYGVQHAWTQKSDLWRLPYMKNLHLPHNIDVMHTEKNVVEALWGTIMDIPEKSKDNVWLSAKSPPSTRAEYLALGEGVAPTLNGGAYRDGKRGLRREPKTPLGACTPRGSSITLGEARFTSGASTCGLRREFPLGEAFNEWERAFTERIPTLDEDPESISGRTHLPASRLDHEGMGGWVLTRHPQNEDVDLAIRSEGDNENDRRSELSSHCMKSSQSAPTRRVNCQRFRSG